MGRKQKIKEELEEEIYVESNTKKDIKEERREEPKKLLKASEWAKESGLPFQDFLWWDTNEKLITKERFGQIRKQVGR
jgi:hypothetical protein